MFDKSSHKTTSPKGFTIIEVMIVVVIVGILAAVAIPLYMTYIQKARVVSYVYPGLHAIETNIALHYARQRAFPDTSQLGIIMSESDTEYYNVAITGNTLQITIDSPASTSKLYALDNLVLYARPKTNDSAIVTWELSGPLARRLGLSE